MRRYNKTGLGVLSALAVLASPVSAQRADEDVLTSAEDAFGTSLGRESFGLYGPGNVRGFSPEAAGNTRIEGLFFDQAASLTGRVRQGSTIRVGLTAIGYPFPAPTGIVDLAIRVPGEERRATMTGGISDNWGQFLEGDVDLPMSATAAINLATGAYRDENGTSNGGDFLTAGTTFRWSPTPGTRLLLFAGQSEVWDAEISLAFRMPGGGLPPRVSRTRFLGPSWAVAESRNSNFGAILGAAPGPGWRLDIGAFRSVGSGFGSFTNIATGIAADGSAERIIIGRQDDKRASWSGEVRLARDIREGPRTHRFILLGRGRAVDARFGGDVVTSLGRFPLEQRIEPPEPDLPFGPQTDDRVCQTTLGLGYAGRWGRALELSAGIQRTDYRKTVSAPGLPDAERRDRPWLPNALVGLTLSPRIALYAGFTEGLEETGTAPAEAANRGEVLPALITRQVEAGARFVLPANLRLVTGLFRIEKPYFALDEEDVFRERGIVRHQGLEMSLSGTPAPGFTLLAGGVLLDATVSGPEVEQGLIGPRPIGRARETAILALDWRPKPDGPWSFDLFAEASGERIATRDNQTAVPGFLRADLGLRYRTRIGQSPATFRLQVANIGNRFVWQVRGDGFYSPNRPRTLRANLTVDM